MTVFSKKAAFIIMGLFFSWTVKAQIDSLAVDSIVKRIKDILEVYDSKVIYIDTSDYEHYYVHADDINLQIAASKGACYEILRLISKGADINNFIGNNATPLHYAVASGSKEAVEILLLLGADRDKYDVFGYTPLISAVNSNDLEMAELLIRYKASISLSDRNRSTSLHHSIANGNFFITDMLLYYEMPLELTDSEGNTPLMLSVWRGDYDISDILLNAGADPNAADRKGVTPFLLAAQKGDTLMMSILSNYGANIYTSDNTGCNALCTAIRNGNEEAVIYLLHLGNLWNTALEAYNNPVDIAFNYGHREMVPLLKEKGFKGSSGFLLEDFSFTAGGILSTHYSLLSATVALREPRLKAGLIAGADFNPVRNRLLVVDENDIIYQYRVQTTVIHAGIFKEFTLNNSVAKGRLSVVTSLSAGYRFHSYYSGTRLKPDDRFCIIPYTGVEWAKKSFGLKAGLCYLHTPFYKVSPVWFKFGGSFNYYKGDKRIIEKKIKIYENK